MLIELIFVEHGLFDLGRLLSISEAQTIICVLINWSMTPGTDAGARAVYRC
jgi:hypothetical protein